MAKDESPRIGKYRVKTTTGSGYYGLEPETGADIPGVYALEEDITKLVGKTKEKKPVVVESWSRRKVLGADAWVAKLKK